jgi:hypothetical protein
LAGEGELEPVLWRMAWRAPARAGLTRPIDVVDLDGSFGVGWGSKLCLLVFPTARELAGRDGGTVSCSASFIGNIEDARRVETRVDARRVLARVCCPTLAERSRKDRRDPLRLVGVDTSVSGELGEASSAGPRSTDGLGVADAGVVKEAGRAEGDVGNM